jgi:hypothetical protein
MKIFLTFIFVAAIATLGVMNGNVQAADEQKAEASVADTEAAVVAEAEVAEASVADTEAAVVAEAEVAAAAAADAEAAASEEHPKAEHPK